MQVEVTFDTSVPRDLQKLREIVGMEGISGLTEMETDTVAAESVDEIPDAIGKAVDEETDDIPDAVAEYISDDGSEEDEEVVSPYEEGPIEEMKGRVQTENGPAYLRQQNGELTNAGKVVQFLLDNPWSPSSAIGEEFGWDPDYTNSVLTSGGNSQSLFINREARSDAITHGNAKEWWVKHQLVTEGE